jgi:hypothetical protein
MTLNDRPTTFSLQVGYSERLVFEYNSLIYIVFPSLKHLKFGAVCKTQPFIPHQVIVLA